MFKAFTDFILSVSYCLKCAQLACPPQSKSRIYPLSLPVKLIYSTHNIDVLTAVFSGRLETILLCSLKSHVTAGAGPTKERVRDETH